jgi:hypothetical protein
MLTAIFYPAPRKERGSPDAACPILHDVVRGGPGRQSPSEQASQSLRRHKLRSSMTDKLPLEKDSPQVQKDRIRRLVSELNSGLNVEFYENRMDPKTSEIRFRLVDNSAGADRIVGSIPQDCEWASSEVADKSDAELLQRLVRIIRR